VEKWREFRPTRGERAYLFNRAVLISDEGLLMTPRRTDTDGFFVSLLRRSE
jgi:16S rRNA (cytosine967-C5)-methyltransferase